MKLEQYLNEALATEMGLVRQLQAQLTMTPEGSYRSAVERHLGETRTHAERVQKRIGEIGGHENPWVVGLNVAETVAAQWLALAKTPWDMMRGTGIEEKVLKNAKDSAAAEALEIVTYEAIEHLARGAGDEETAALAAEIRADEERMLAQIREELPGLVEAVAQAEAGEHGGVTVRARAAVRRRRGGREAAPAGEPEFASEPASAGPAAPVGEPAPAASPAAPSEPAPTASPAAPAKPAAAADRAAPSAGGEPWPGYDDQNVRQIGSRLADADADLARAVVEYERAHKNRSSVITAAERHT